MFIFYPHLQGLTESSIDFDSKRMVIFLSLYHPSMLPSNLLYFAIYYKNKMISLIYRLNRLITLHTIV